ncbi:hypothetical protein AG1IA_02306 [Rhizoctonia solani AG-1 IA]|uniref:Uncharacterized protein n=1 Tax=Thanatephorus cucumeris (strain AG1-IA) TaxID=983506 RepID=L8X4V6_THACA|nr:hypothetical protein AG1IA_02306 [Rhizoctonia solani AG-1 IA]
MPRLKTRMIWSVLIVATWVEVALAYSINATIYDTNTAHVTYSDTPIACKRWVNSWLFWKVCDSWVEPWAPSTYHLQGKVSTLHSSLNHQTASLSVDFKGTVTNIPSIISVLTDVVTRNRRLGVWSSIEPIN